MPERNPYLILGVDFAAPAERSRHAFAHAARRARREGGAWAVEDLTWALHEIEALDENPGDLVSLYRVPADPGVFVPGGSGLLDPPAVPLERGGPPDPAAVEALRRRAAAELDALLLTFAAEVAPPVSTYQVAEV